MIKGAKGTGTLANGLTNLYTLFAFGLKLLAGESVDVISEVNCFYSPRNKIILEHGSPVRLAFSFISPGPTHWTVAPFLLHKGDERY